MTETHAERGHSVWSASATARNVHCPGAIAMTLGMEGGESIHSARGTAAHEVAERALKLVKSPCEASVGDVIKTKSYEITVDQELADSAQMYVDYVNDASAHKPRWFERRFSFEDLKPPFEAGGTADAVIYHPETFTLEVVDLKNGMGIVDVEGNMQGRSYALGALLSFPEVRIDFVKVTIVQPRAYHKNGPIRSETFPAIDMMDWTDDLLDVMAKSKEALDSFVPDKPNAHWEERYLHPGHCYFCPAAATCPALKRKAQAKLLDFFEPIEDEKEIVPTKGKLKPSMDALKIAETLDQLDLMEDFISAVRGRAKFLVEQGETIPGYGLVAKHGHRKWREEDEVKLAATLAARGKLDLDEVYNSKLKSPAQIEKLLGKAGKDLIKDMWTTPVTGTNLVRVDRTEREILPAPIDVFFEPVEPESK